MKLSPFLLILIFSACLDLSKSQSPDLQSCRICSQCASCSQDVRQDQTVDELHALIQTHLNPTPYDKLKSLTRTQLSANVFQYHFVYVSGFYTLLKANLLTGDVSIDSYQTEQVPSATDRCPTCPNAASSTSTANSATNSNSQSQSSNAVTSSSNVSNTTKNTPRQNVSSTATSTSATVPSTSTSASTSTTSTTNAVPATANSSIFSQGIRSPKTFFTSIKEFSMTSTSPLQLLNNFIFRTFFSAQLFRGLTSFPASKVPVNVNRIKPIYYKAYSVKYFRLIFVFLNERPNGEINTTPTLEFYELIVSQEPSGFNLVSGTRINEREFTWNAVNTFTSASSSVSTSNLSVSLDLRSGRILDSSRFDTSSLNLSFFTKSPQTSQPSTEQKKTSLTTNEAVTTTTSSSSSESESSSYDYREVPNIATNPEVLSLNKFSSEYFYLTYRRLQLRKVEREFILKRKEGEQGDEILSYRLTYRIRKMQDGVKMDEPLHYEIIVTKYIKSSGAISFQISNANYINLLPLYEVRSKLQATAMTPKQVKEDENLPFIDSIVLKEFKQELGPQPPIVRIKRHEPYYELTYMDLKNKEIRITLLYEIVMNLIEFYVEGGANTSVSEKYKYLTDSGKRAQGNVGTNLPKTSGTSNFSSQVTITTSNIVSNGGLASSNSPTLTNTQKPQSDRNETLSTPSLKQPSINQNPIVTTIKGETNASFNVLSSSQTSINDTASKSGSSLTNQQINQGPNSNSQSTPQTQNIVSQNTESSQNQISDLSQSSNRTPSQIDGQIQSQSNTQSQIQINTQSQTINQNPTNSLPQSITSSTTQPLESSQPVDAPQLPVINPTQTISNQQTSTLLASGSSSMASSTATPNKTLPSNVSTAHQPAENIQVFQNNQTSLSQFWAKALSSSQQGTQPNKFTFVSVPKLQVNGQFSQGPFSELKNYFSLQQVNRLVNFLLNRYGQSINFFMKLDRVDFSQSGDNTNSECKRSAFKMQFQIRRYETLSEEAKTFTEGVLMYEIAFDYSWLVGNPSNTSINLLGSQYLNSFCYFAESGDSVAMLNRIARLMSFDQSNLISDQYYVTINQLLMSYEVPNQLDRATRITKNVPFKELVNKAYIKRVGRLLPYYQMEYNNGVIAIVWYEVLTKQIFLIALTVPNSVESSSNSVNLQPQIVTNPGLSTTTVQSSNGTGSTVTSGTSSQSGSSSNSSNSVPNSSTKRSVVQNSTSSSRRVIVINKTVNTNRNLSNSNQRNSSGSVSSNISGFGSSTVNTSSQIQIDISQLMPVGEVASNRTSVNSSVNTINSSAVTNLNLVSVRDVTALNPTSQASSTVINSVTLVPVREENSISSSSNALPLISSTQLNVTNAEQTSIKGVSQPSISQIDPTKDVVQSKTLQLNLQKVDLNDIRAGQTSIKTHSLGGTMEPFGPIHIVDETVQLKKQQIQKKSPNKNLTSPQIATTSSQTSQLTQIQQQAAPSSVTNQQSQSQSNTSNNNNLNQSIIPTVNNLNSITTEQATTNLIGMNEQSEEIRTEVSQKQLQILTQQQNQIQQQKQIISKQVPTQNNVQNTINQNLTLSNTSSHTPNVQTKPSTSQPLLNTIQPATNSSQMTANSSEVNPNSSQSTAGSSQINLKPSQFTQSSSASSESIVTTIQSGSAPSQPTVNSSQSPPNSLQTNPSLSQSTVTSTNSGKSQSTGSSSQAASSSSQSSMTQNRPSLNTSQNAISSTTQSQSVVQKPQAIQTPLINLTTKLSQSERTIARQTIQNVQKVSISKQIEGIDGTKFMTVRLMQYEQLPSGMLNDFMSPYYMVFREDFLFRNVYTPNGRVQMVSQAAGSARTTANNTNSVQFDMRRFSTVFMKEFLQFTMIPIQQLPTFEVIIYHSIYDSGFRVVVSCGTLRKVYEIIFTKLNYLVLSFKQIQSLREITLAVNQIQYLVQKSVDKEGKPLNTIQQFTLVRNYAQLVRLFIKDLEVEQIKEVSLSFVPEGFAYQLSYIARRRAINPVTGRQSIQKEWYETEVIYETDAGNLMFSRHKLFKEGVDLTDKSSMLFPKQDSWQLSWLSKSNVSIADGKILMAIETANRQLDVLFAGSEWKIDENEWQAQVYQARGQSSQEAYISMRVYISEEVSIHVIFLYSFSLERIISLELLTFGNGWYVPIRAYDKRDQLLNTLKPIHQQVIKASQEISMRMFKNQLMAGENIPEHISLRRSPFSKHIYYKLQFNIPALYELILKVTLTPSQQLDSIQLVGTRRTTEEVSSADQFYDHLNRDFQGFVSVDPLSIKYDQIYNSLFNHSLIKYPSIKSSKLLAIYTKQTPQQLNYRLVLDISSVVNIIDMTFDKLNFAKIDTSMYADKAFSVNGFYQRNCLKQSSKGYCVICNNQFTASPLLLSNGRCYETIPRCQSQLAFACLYCMPGFQLYNNQCIQSNIITSQMNRMISSLNSVNALDRQGNYKICKTFDVRGNCVECPDEEIHVLYESICYFRSQMVLSVKLGDTQNPQMVDNVRSDEFCKRWISGICIDCIQGSIMGATRKCQASRDNCINYNVVERKCVTCTKDYKNVSGRCIR